MTIVKIRELIGTSSKSFEDALQNIVAHEVVAGAGPGSKYDKAKKLGVKIIGEDDFKQLVRD